MILPHNCLILVTDGRKMLMLRNKGSGDRIELQTERHEMREDRKDREIKTDAPGLTGQSAGFGRPAMEEPDYHQLDEERWAAETTNIINMRALAHEFEQLVVIAPPKTMGELRSHWHKEVEQRIVSEITKEMTDRPLPEIEALLRGESAPPAGGGE